MKRFRVKYQDKYLKSFEGEGLLFSWLLPDKYIDISFFLERENDGCDLFKVEQFTGTYDCNDRPIYEGDIIRHKEFGEQEVVFRDGAFKLKIGTYLPNHTNKNVFEII
jgi:hypothetical protein